MFCRQAVGSTEFVMLLMFRTILKESGYPRYLHSSVLLGGTLLMFGGNTHNDTSLSNGAKCFSADFLVYDVGLYRIFISMMNKNCILASVRLIMLFMEVFVFL